MRLDRKKNDRAIPNSRRELRKWISRFVSRKAARAFGPEEGP